MSEEGTNGGSKAVREGSRKRGSVWEGESEGRSEGGREGGKNRNKIEKNEKL